MAFHNNPFPRELSALTPKTSWKTLIVELGGGGEQRAILWGDARRRYNAATPTLTLAQYLEIEKHFNARRGRGFSFPLRDRSSWVATTEAIGVGPGTAFQLMINSGDAGNAYNREIYLPESGTVHVYDNAVEIVEGAGAGKFTVPYSGSTAGLVTLGTSLTSGHILTASYHYYVPVRYDVDELPDSRLFVWKDDNTGLVSGPEIPLIEVRYASEF